MATFNTLPLPFLASVLIGWLGGVHCFGMCGGIVSALSLSVPGSRRPALLLSYNLGRCITYISLGFMAGVMGYASTTALGVAPRFLFGLANLLLVGMGLYLLGLPQFVRPLERTGQLLWRYMEPLARSFLPINTIGRAFLVGLIWGFLPCGLVYSALVTSMSIANPLSSAAWMAGFALGTLPNLLLAGWLGAGLLNRLRQSSIRWIAGGLIIVWGVYGLMQLGVPVWLTP